MNARPRAFLLFVISICTTVTAEGQSPIVLGEPVTVVDDFHAMRPVFSPDSQALRLAFTTSNYRGLWVMDVASRTMTLLTDERSAGFGFKWSNDGAAIAARVASYDGQRRSDVIKVFSADAAQVHSVSAIGARIRSLPEWTAANEALVVSAARRHRRIPNPIQNPVSSKAPSTAIIARDSTIVRISADDVETVLRDFPKPVLNLAVSPDRAWLAFEILGGDLFVCAADGSRLTSLGRGSRPAWSPDSRWIVFTETLDDGHRVTSSDLMVGSVTGQSWRLTATPEVLEMNPSWSPRGDQLAYDADGRIFTIPVSENR